VEIDIMVYRWLLGSRTAAALNPDQVAEECWAQIREEKKEKKISKAENIEAGISTIF
jgi:hypothetical protein